MICLADRRGVPNKDSKRHISFLPDHALPSPKSDSSIKESNHNETKSHTRDKDLIPSQRVLLDLPSESHVLVLEIIVELKMPLSFEFHPWQNVA